MRWWDEMSVQEGMNRVAKAFFGVCGNGKNVVL